MENIKKIKDIPNENLNEIIQDALFFNLFLRIKRNMTNDCAKNYMSMFLKPVAPLFVWELATALQEYYDLDRNKIYGDREKYNLKIKNERNKIKQQVKNSDSMSYKVGEMGIDFNDLVYDINIILNQSKKLLDFNFEQYNEEEDLAFWNGVFLFPETIFNTANIGELDNLFEESLIVLKPFTDILEQNINGESFSYSSNKLFKNSDGLSEEDKILFLFRYRLIESTILIGMVFNDGEISLVNEVFDFSLKRYLRKYKAFVIEIIGKELLALKTDYSISLCSILTEKMPDNFFSINRKLRNTFHYTKKINILTDDEIQLLDKYQDLYLNIIAESFNKNLSVELDEECMITNEIIKECIAKGMSVEETKEIYEELFLKKWQEKNN